MAASTLRAISLYISSRKGIITFVSCPLRIWVTTAIALSIVVQNFADGELTVARNTSGSDILPFCNDSCSRYALIKSLSLSS